MIQAYPFKSAEILDLIFKTKLKGFPCNFVLIFFKKLKGLQVTGDPFNFKTPLHKNPCKTPVNPFKHLQYETVLQHSLSCDFSALML